MNIKKLEMMGQTDEVVVTENLASCLKCGQVKVFPLSLVVNHKSRIPCLDCTPLAVDSLPVMHVELDHRGRPFTNWRKWKSAMKRLERSGL